MKKVMKYTSLFILFLAADTLTAQNLSGRWQAGSDQINSNLLDSYIFYPNYKFTYELNQYNGLSRIVSLSGTYKLSGNQIEFTILSSKEKAGGTFFRDHTLSENDSWTLDDYKIIEK